MKLLISRDKSIDLDNNEVFINEKLFTDYENMEPEAFALMQMRLYYRNILSNHFENLIILTGSGSSVDIGTDTKGKTMKGLWECVIGKIEEKRIIELCSNIRFNEYKKEYTDLEALLSKAKLVNEYKEDPEIEALIEEIRDIIKSNCTLKLPEASPHESLLGKITARKLKYQRPKIFTLNYDTLFEQTASRYGYIIIDGFSFSYPRRFGGKNFDYDIVIRENSRIKNEENYAKRIFHLYKLHGSLDWEIEEDYIKKSESPSKPVMIYPMNSKYESSFEQPFFEMMSRFQQNLRRPNTFLITIGFSYYDKHISSMIREALNINPSFRLMAVNYGIDDNEKMDFINTRAKIANNVFVVNEKFADFADNFPYPEVYLNSIGDDNKDE